MKTLLAFLSLVFAGCGAIYAPSPLQDGHIAIAADAKGMRAFGDSLNGLIVNGKASPDVKGAHFQFRELEEQEGTKRLFAPNFMQKLFASPQE